MSGQFNFNKVFIEAWKNRLTKYERARVIGARALQLAMGAPPFIDVSTLKKDDVFSIAEAELESGVLPITIRRVYPNGRVELVSLKKQ
ncbi:MAG: DNA-directed RNA polymerase subunit K [Thermoprotei archaeon]